jgi:hypothetical protein
MKTHGNGPLLGLNRFLDRPSGSAPRSYAEGTFTGGMIGDIDLDADDGPARVESCRPIRAVSPSSSPPWHPSGPFGSDQARPRPRGRYTQTARYPYPTRSELPHVRPELPVYRPNGSGGGRPDAPAVGTGLLRAPVRPSRHRSDSWSLETVNLCRTAIVRARGSNGGSRGS